MLQQIKQRFGITGNDSVLNRAINLAIKMARTNMGVLITGENGSGKESFAKIIHHLSHHKHGKFIAVNCGAIPEGTIDSELFGHEKGAFTSADGFRKGYFEEAEEGTLFLDEIGEMPLHTQPRLLRVLENKEYMRVGSSQRQLTNARIVAATNKDLQQAVEAGKFREDLYYRIAQMQIPIPPLRERGEDIHLLFRKFALDLAEKNQTPLIRLTAEAKDLLLQYHFPGNVRQLKNIIWQIDTLETASPTITEKVLQKYLPKSVEATKVSALSVPLDLQTIDSERTLLYKTLFTMQKELQELKQVLFEFMHTQADGRLLLNTYGKLFGNAPREPEVEKVPPNAPLTLCTSTADAESYVEEPTLKAQEKTLIKRVLAASKSYKVAAKKLGISERTLYRKVETYNL